MSLSGKTMVVFDGDMDKAMAAFIIANGAAAMGGQVTMFFTFWGLNVLRKGQKIKVKKGFMEKMFGMMMPRGVDKLKISKIEHGGHGHRHDEEGHAEEKCKLPAGADGVGHEKRGQDRGLHHVHGRDGDHQGRIDRRNRVRRGGLVLRGGG